MSETTEHYLIRYLKERIHTHQVEITKLENIITSFNGLCHPCGYPIPEEKISNGLTVSSVEVQSYPGYDPAASIEEKILFALKEIRSGYKVDIAAVLVRYEPGSTLPEMIKKIGGTLSTLKGRLKLTAVRSVKRLNMRCPMR
ncbi:hypothetical protein [Mucilaginibacter sp. PAMB04168]|uniref:hypothetical protein n=1 Tax=Mucilaginibacter sp. PAMB04168 TaxID=3138567 RepID=UPI0031F62CFB